MAPDYYLCDDSSFVRNRLPLMLQAVEHARHLMLSPRVIETLLGTVPDALEGRSVFRFERAGRCDEAHRHLSPRQFARAMRYDDDIECNHSWFRQKPNRIGFSRNLQRVTSTVARCPMPAFSWPTTLASIKCFWWGGFEH